MDESTGPVEDTEDATVAAPLTAYERQQVAEDVGLTEAQVNEIWNDTESSTMSAEKKEWWRRVLRRFYVLVRMRM